MPSIPFVCYETPYCVWDDDPKQRNIEYIQGIDPEFFKTSVLAFGQLLDDDVKARHAATGLRLLYTHSLETLLALICAMVQAPHSVFAWLIKYRERHLKGLIDDISKRKRVKHLLNIDHLTWESLSNLVHQFVVLEDKEKEQKIKTGFGRFWGFSASQYLNDISHQEYNSIKHALRVQSSGHVLSIGLEYEYGVAPPQDEMHPVMASKYGSVFLTPASLGEDKISFGVKSNSTGWHPQSLIYGIQLVSNSICNIKSFLLASHGTDPSTLQWYWPQDLSLLDFDWLKQAPGSGSTSFGPYINEDELFFPTKDEILKHYDRDDSTRENS